MIIRQTAFDPSKKSVFGHIAHFRVAAPVTDRLRDFPLDMEKYKALQVFPMQEDKDQEDCNFFLIIW